MSQYERFLQVAAHYRNIDEAMGEFEAARGWYRRTKRAVDRVALLRSGIMVVKAFYPSTNSGHTVRNTVRNTEAPRITVAFYKGVVRLAEGEDGGIEEIVDFITLGVFLENDPMAKLSEYGTQDGFTEMGGVWVGRKFEDGTVEAIWEELTVHGAQS